MSRAVWKIVLALVCVSGAAGRLEAQRGGGPPGPPQPARVAAPIDLTGYWVSIVTQNWRWRMVTPAQGDYGRIPVSVEGRKVADAWDPAADEAAGEQCKSYGAPALMGVPGRLHITWENDDTLRIDTDAGMQTRLLQFARPRDAAAEPRSWQGVSVAEWIRPRANVPLILRPMEQKAGDNLLAAPRGGSLHVVTTNLRSGYMRKNGVPYSEETVLTEHWDVFAHQNGDEWLTITTRVEDPRYFRQPYLIAIPFKREADGTRWDPTPCSATW
jgi:hypothetical protein